MSDAPSSISETSGTAIALPIAIGFFAVVALYVIVFQYFHRGRRREAATVIRPARARAPLYRLSESDLEALPRYTLNADNFTSLVCPLQNPRSMTVEDIEKLMGTKPGPEVVGNDMVADIAEKGTDLFEAQMLFMEQGGLRLLRSHSVPIVEIWGADKTKKVENIHRQLQKSVTFMGRAKPGNPKLQVGMMKKEFERQVKELRESKLTFSEIGSEENSAETASAAPEMPKPVFLGTRFTTSADISMSPQMRRGHTHGPNAHPRPIGKSKTFFGAKGTFFGIGNMMPSIFSSEKKPKEPELSEKMDEAPNGPNMCEGTVCSICIEEFEVGEEVRQLPCKHVFHVECINPWLLRPRKAPAACPLCKQQVFKDQGDPMPKPDPNEFHDHPGAHNHSHGNHQNIDTSAPPQVQINVNMA